MDAPESAPVTGPVCPWCSAALTSADRTTCPACGANVEGDPDVEIEGVTALDQDTRVRLGLIERAANPPPRRGLFSLLGGDPEPELGLDPETVAILGQASVEPPSADVRREMLRLEMEDLQRELEREAAALASASLAVEGEAAWGMGADPALAEHRRGDVDDRTAASPDDAAGPAGSPGDDTEHAEPNDAPGGDSTD